MSGSIVLLGIPDSGKTNYVVRLWPALGEKKFELIMAVQPAEIGFVLESADHLFEGQFIQRSEHTEDRREFAVRVRSRTSSAEADILVPDIAGELWKKAVGELEAPDHMIKSLRDASGALLFVRVHSDQNVQPLDWVTSKKFLAKTGQVDDAGMPTQVVLCELIRFLEMSLARRPDGGKPRLSVIVSAWDIVDPEVFELGPAAYIAKEYPLLAGRLDDLDGLDARVFGLSIVGGDLSDDSFRDEYLENGMDGSGWVAVLDPETNTWQKDVDLTLPAAWAIGL